MRYSCLRVNVGIHEYTMQTKVPNHIEEITIRLKNICQSIASVQLILATVNKSTFCIYKCNWLVHDLRSPIQAKASFILTMIACGALIDDRIGVVGRRLKGSRQYSTLRFIFKSKRISFDFANCKLQT